MLICRTVVIFNKRIGKEVYKEHFHVKGSFRVGNMLQAIRETFPQYQTKAFETRLLEGEASECNACGCGCDEEEY